MEKSTKLGGMKLSEKCLVAANEVLSSFVDAWIEPRKGGMYVCWRNEREGLVDYRWMCRGQDFYPVWNRHYPGGGTSVTALSQLVRWLQGKPVLPLDTWYYWASKPCKLLPEGVPNILKEAGYPEKAKCVLCDNEISNQLDWWNLDGVSGPCCGWTTGCRQRGKQ